MNGIMEPSSLAMEQIKRIEKAMRATDTATTVMKRIDNITTLVNKNTKYAKGEYNE